jgi:hypothetical protein
MDKHVTTLILGTICILLGLYMRFNKKHYTGQWKTTGLSKGFDPESAKRIARFQGLIVFFMGIFFLFLGIFG